MHYQPLVSVTMPAYNAEQTILRAIKSLQSQTYKNWECIVVDDGSTDSTANIVKAIDDDRIKLISLERNMGRGHARQIALDKCSGDFIAMLDSDDWYYNTKLELQVDAFIKNPELTVVSCGMAITDKNGHLVGVRSLGDDQVKFFYKPTVIPIPHAASMYKANKAKKIKYDPRFKLAQDVDYLRRLLINQKFMLLNTVGYVYEEHASNKPSKTLKAYIYSALGYAKFFKSSPVYSSYRIAVESAKLSRFLVYLSAGKYQSLIASRSKKPNNAQLNEYKNQKEKLDR